MALAIEKKSNWLRPISTSLTMTINGTALVRLVKIGKSAAAFHVSWQCQPWKRNQCESCPQLGCPVYIVEESNQSVDGFLTNWITTDALSGKCSSAETAETSIVILMLAWVGTSFVLLMMLASNFISLLFFLLQDFLWNRSPCWWVWQTTTAAAAIVESWWCLLTLSPCCNSQFVNE